MAVSGYTPGKRGHLPFTLGKCVRLSVSCFEPAPVFGDARKSLPMSLWLLAVEVELVLEELIASVVSVRSDAPGTALVRSEKSYEMASCTSLHEKTLANSNPIPNYQRRDFGNKFIECP